MSILNLYLKLKNLKEIALKIHCFTYLISLPGVVLLCLLCHLNLLLFERGVNFGGKI